ncbi:MAG: RluA family pseudouridine synthase [Elusimicrobia bacterium]|nr:RluA family pseudouridine synthase [Elusimicrobiota bacterium]
MPVEKTFLYKGAPERLDRYLADRLSPLSRTYIQSLIKQGHVDLNGSLPVARQILAPGDKVHIQLPEFSNLPASSAETVPVLYEDQDLIVVNKPADMVVHPAGPHQEDTLIQRLWPKLAPQWASAVKGSSPKTARPGVVHRLDRGTSGVMVIAKTPVAAENLSRQFAERVVQKVYWALVRGIPSTETGRIRSTVGRSRRQPHRMSVEDPGRWSETEFRVLGRFPKFEETGAALLEIHPLTGRTHQIRVQLASLGHSLLGDRVYGPPQDAGAKRPFLHALNLEIRHPSTGKTLSWTAPLPEDYKKALKRLGWKKKS